MGFDAAIVTNVPLGGGLSSSASLEMACATFLEALYGLTVDSKTKVQRCVKCEHEYCNMPCKQSETFLHALSA